MLFNMGCGRGGEKIQKIKAVIIIISVLIKVMPATAASATEAPSLTAEAAVLFAAENGQVLFEKNMQRKMYPASVTKILTGLLALERGSLPDILTASSDAVFSIRHDSSHIALDVGEEITLEQALFALAVASANDAANVIAEYIAGSQESFGRLMTARAIELGAENSNFVNAHGLPHKNHYTTAYDMALIMAEAVKNPVFLEIFSKGRYEMQPTNLQPEIRYLNNSNPLLRGEHNYEGILASKKGWAQEAKHTLVTAAERDGRKLIAVVLGSDSSDGAAKDTINLLDYGFNEFLQIESPLAEELAAAGSRPEIEAEDGQQTVTYLLHKKLPVQAVKRTLSFSGNPGRTVLELSLAVSEDNGLMYHRIGKYSIALTSHIAEKKPEGTGTGSFLRFFLRFLLFLLLPVFLLLVRKYARRRLRGKKRRRHRIIYRY